MQVDGGAGGLGPAAAVAARYHSVEPVASWGVDRRKVSWSEAPIEEVLVYAHDGPTPHWHYVGLGLTAQSARPGAPSGELTFRLERSGEVSPPVWPCSLLNHVASYLVAAGATLDVGHTFDLNAPVTPDAPSPLRHLLFASDPDLPGPFLQAVGITSDELTAHERWPGFADVLAEHVPMLVTRPRRTSTLALPGVVAQVDAQSGVGAERAALFVTTFDVRPSARLARLARKRPSITVTMSTHPVDALRRALLNRVANGAPFLVRGGGTELLLVPEEGVGPHREEPNCWVVGLSPDQRSPSRTLSRPSSARTGPTPCRW